MPRLTAAERGAVDTWPLAFEAQLEVDFSFAPTDAGLEASERGDHCREVGVVGGLPAEEFTFDAGAR